VVPYGPFFGGVRAAIGDFNTDSVPDFVTVPATSGGPHVKVFNGATGAVLKSFMAFPTSYTFGLNVVTSDLNEDGYSDIILATNGGIRAAVRVFSGRDYTPMPKYSLNPYGSFTGAIQVATDDFDKDNVNDIIVTAQSGPNKDFRIYSGRTGALITSYLNNPPSSPSDVGIASTIRPPEVTIISPSPDLIIPKLMWSGSIDGVVKDGSYRTSKVSVAVRNPFGLWLGGRSEERSFDQANKSRIWNTVPGKNSWRLSTPGNIWIAGRYTVEVLAEDSFGNTSIKTMNFRIS
jgi:hypothetical protein